MFPLTLNLSEQKLAQVTKYCPNSNLIKINVLLIDLSEDGSVIKMERLIIPLKCRFMRELSYTKEMPIFSVRMTPNSPEYKISIDSDQVLDITTFEALRAIVRKHNYSHEFIWENDQYGVSKKS